MWKNARRTVELCFQPSSSLRAAELLEASGAAAGGFSVGVAFTGVDSVKLTSDEASVDCDDVDFNLVIKRMSKKDSTTKLKVARYSDLP